MKTYRCTRRVLHDGETLAPGDFIELDDKAARSLISIGAVLSEEMAHQRAGAILESHGFRREAASEDVDALKAAVAGIGDRQAEIMPALDRAPSALAAVAEPDSETVAEAASLDALIEQAIRAFGPEDFTKGGEPRMSALADAVQKLDYPNGEEAGVVIEAEDRDRVFKAMTDARFEVPKVVAEGGGD